MNLNRLGISKEWTLFLDRDGVINRKLENDYVKNLNEFEFIPGALDAITVLNNFFGKTVVVTNQQGIGKGLYSINDLNTIHNYMCKEVINVGGKIDGIYFCPDLASSNSVNRKPNTGMAEQAKRDFPEINYEKSVIVGDSKSDMEFGKRLGMITIFISSNSEKPMNADRHFASLEQFATFLQLRN